MLCLVFDYFFFISFVLFFNATRQMNLSGMHKI